MALFETVKKALRYPDLAQPSDLAFLLQTLAQDVDDFTAGYIQNVFASRPAATGIDGTFFYATDTSTLYVSDGTTWHIVGSNNRIGLYVDRPAANTVAVGTKYFATNQVVEYISDGTDWIRISVPAGVTDICLASTADAGYILLQGQAWPATTGIYADLYARWGSPAVVPDMQTFVPVGRKAGDTDFGTLLGTGGSKTHTLTAAQLPANIPHNLTLPNHVHPPLTGGNKFETAHDVAGPVNSEGPGPGNIDSATLDATTGNPTTNPAINGNVNNTGGGNSHPIMQPYKVVNFQAKL